jgi:hypothetical protein
LPRSFTRRPPSGFSGISPAPMRTKSLGNRWSGASRIHEVWPGNRIFSVDDCRHCSRKVSDAVLLSFRRPFSRVALTRLTVCRNAGRCRGPSEDRASIHRSKYRSVLPVCFSFSPLSPPGAPTVVVDLISYGLHKIACDRVKDTKTKSRKIVNIG